MNPFKTFWQTFSIPRGTYYAPYFFNDEVHTKEVIGLGIWFFIILISLPICLKPLLVVMHLLGFGLHLLGLWYKIWLS